MRRRRGGAGAAASLASRRHRGGIATRRRGAAARSTCPRRAPRLADGAAVRGDLHAEEVVADLRGVLRARAFGLAVPASWNEGERPAGRRRENQLGRTSVSPSAGISDAAARPCPSSGRRWRPGSSGRGGRTRGRESPGAARAAPFRTRARSRRPSAPAASCRGSRRAARGPRGPRRRRKKPADAFRVRTARGALAAGSAGPSGSRGSSAAVCGGCGALGRIPFGRLRLHEGLGKVHCGQPFRSPRLESVVNFR